MSESEAEAESNQLDKFGGIIDLNLKIRIPYCFYKAVKEYCDLTNTRIKEWFNDEIILAIESLELDYVNQTFIKKYHLHELTWEKTRKAAPVQGAVNTAIE
jgi:hypothetical protein